MKKACLKGLGPLECAVMEALWRRNTASTAREVGRCLVNRREGKRDIAHTTVMTVLNRLAKKGFLIRERADRVWHYRPTASREAYVADLMLGALELTHDRDAALAQFARSVTGDDAVALRSALLDDDASQP